jgi:Benzoate membrane transport protein.
VAIVTFLVVASGIQLLNIGSALWGLVVGAIVMLVLSAGRRRRIGSGEPESSEPAPG